MKQITQLVAATALVVGALGFAAPSFAVDFVEAKPMSEQVAPGFRACRGGEGVNVPTITWGGDIVAYEANGRSDTTQAGSVFQKNGLNVTLKREDVFARQVERYMNCETPYLRGTAGQLVLASGVTEQRSETSMVIVHQISWSNGGDALVAGPGIDKPADLAGKTIALQANGPHVDYLFKLLSDAGVDTSTVTLVWTKDLTGLDSNSTPALAMMEGKADAAMVIIPDALALTSGGNVGSGAEGSVQGAKILLSTKSASRIIADVYAVRKDYFDANRAEVQTFVASLLQAEEQLRQLYTERDSRKDEFQAMLKSAATHLLDAPSAIADAEGLFLDAETVGAAAGRKFFTDAGYPRRFERLNAEVNDALVAQGLLASGHQLAVAGWDYNLLANGLSLAEAQTPRFDNDKLSAAVTAQSTAGGLDSGELFRLQINFRPNQNDFPIEAYQDQFNRVIELAATYPGAVLTIEGHSDVLGYLKARKASQGQAVLARIRQSARNLSISRANSVRDAVVELAARQKATMDQSQFVTIGHGITQPLTGIGTDGVPHAPQTQAEWMSNMRVVFRIVNIEAEQSQFELLD